MRVEPLRGWVLLVVLGVAWVIAGGYNGYSLFQSLGNGVTGFLELAGYGSRFLFGNLSAPEHFSPVDAGWPGFGFQFVFYLLPLRRRGLLDPSSPKDDGTIAPCPSC